MGSKHIGAITLPLVPTPTLSSPIHKEGRENDGSQQRDRPHAPASAGKHPRPMASTFCNYSTGAWPLLLRHSSREGDGTTSEPGAWCGDPTPPLPRPPVSRTNHFVPVAVLSGSRTTWKRARPMAVNIKPDADWRRPPSLARSDLRVVTLVLIVGPGRWNLHRPPLAPPQPTCSACAGSARGLPHLRARSRTTCMTSGKNLAQSSASYKGMFVVNSSDLR